MAIKTDIEINAALQVIRTEIANQGIKKGQVADSFQNIFDTLNSRVANKQDKIAYYGYGLHDLNSNWSSGIHVLLVEEWENYPTDYYDYQGIVIIESSVIPASDGDFPSKTLLTMTLENGKTFTRVRLGNGTWQDWIEIGFDKEPIAIYSPFNTTFDLNQFTETARIRANIQQPSNDPIDLSNSTAILDVFYVPNEDDNGGHVLQVLTSDGGRIFTRNRLPNGTWQSWLEIGRDKQPLDSDLTAIAAIAPANDDFIQRKAGAWTNRTVAQVKTDLAIASDIAASLVTANAYADGLVVGLWDDRGNFDASVNAYPSTGGSGTAGAIKKGDIWTISVAGTLPTSQVVEVGDTVRALIDTPGATQANWSIQQNNIGYVPENAANKNATGGYVGLSGFAIQFKNAANTFISLISNTNTAIRNYIFPDKNITVAGIEDIQAAAAINATASGTNTYVATIAPSIAALTAGMEFTIQFTNANSGASTLNLNALGAIALVKSRSTALVSGDISAGQRLKVNFDGTNFQIIGGGGSSMSETGLETIQNSATTESTLYVSARRFWSGITQFLTNTNTFSALNTFSFRAVFSGQISTRSAINLPNSATDVTSGAVNGDIKNVSHVLSFFKNGTWRRFLFAEDNPSLTGTGTVVVTANATGDLARGNNIVSLFAYTQTTMPTVVAATLTSILTGTIQGSTTLNSSTDTTNPMMVAGKSYRGFASGIFSSVSGATFQIVIKIGSVTLLDSGAFAMIANTAQPFRIEFDYTVQTTGVSGAITANLIFMINGQTPFIASGSPVTIDTTANRILDVQVAYGATNASNTVNIRQANTINHAN